jgi:hypothetical protein
MVAYSQARFDVCHDLAAFAQQQPLQHLSRGNHLLLCARAEQPRRYRGHELNKVTSPIAGSARAHSLDQDCSNRTRFGFRVSGVPRSFSE